MNLIDVHAHLTDEKYVDLEEVLERAKETGIEKIVCSAYNLSSSLAALGLSKKHDNIYANVGIHPENVDEFDDETYKQLKKLALEKRIVAIGEIGLDYHYTSENKDRQKEIFIKQIELANAVKKPIVVHSRDGMGDTLEILSKHRPGKESLLHCYSGSLESAKILLNLGFSFSFGGVLTFKNAKNVLEVAKVIPLDRILLETDCPFLSPEPFRGQRNEPKNVVYVADKLAQIKGCSIEEIAQATTENAKRLFCL